MSTQEFPFWPRVEIWKAANGWIVQPARGWERDHVTAIDEKVYVFQEWGPCEQFLAQVTEPRRAPNGRGDANG